MQHRDHLEALSGAEGPITFVDALRLVRQYHQFGRSDDQFLNQLVVWIEQAPITQGALKVFTALLESEARKLRHERTRAQRTLGLRDHGRRIRGVCGEGIVIDLESRERLGLEWSLVSRPAGASVEITSDPARPGVLRVTLTPQVAGTCELSMTENEGKRWVRPSGQAKGLEPREFLLTLVTEEP